MSKKVLSIGQFYDGTGYSHAAQNLSLALDAAGVDVACVTINSAGQRVRPHDRILELLDKRITSPDVIIQTILPPAMIYHGGVTNVGYFFCETTDFRRSGWAPYLNNMDEVWTSCQESVLACERSGVKRPIKKVQIAVDKSRFSKVYPFEDLKKGRFAFYSVGDWSARKNISGVVEAYFRAFSKNDNVVLILKTYCESVTADQSAEFISNEIKKIKDSLRLWQNDFYPPVVLITDYLPDEEIYGLHQHCDAYVTMERAAGWGIPLFEAMAFNKPVISIKWGGPAEFLTEGDGNYIIPHSFDLVKGMQTCTYAGMYTGYEGWAEPSMIDAVASMRNIYRSDTNGQIDRSAWLSGWDIHTKGLELATLL